MWLTSYWVEVDTKLKPYYCELHNCMFGGLRLKCTCLASNNRRSWLWTFCARVIMSMHLGAYMLVFWYCKRSGIYTSTSQSPCNYCFGVHCRSVSIAECFSGVKAAQVVTFSFYCSWQTTVQNDISAGRPRIFPFFGDEQFAKWVCFWFTWRLFTTMHSGATGLQSIFRALRKQVAPKDR